MKEIDNNWRENLKNDGFYIQKQFFDKKYLIEINRISNSIIKFDNFFNLFGLGNRTFRNGNIFTGNLLFKNKIFYDLLINKGLLTIPKEILNDFVLSEFKLITSFKHENFSYWWHRDYPYMYGKDIGDVNIGVLIPLIDFSESVGSTVIIPKSHLLNDKPTDLSETKSYAKSNCLETSLGDIFIYDGKLFHSGSLNRSNQIRNLISLQFVKRYIGPCEDMKTQYFELNIKDKKLCDLMTKYHLPHVNKFGCNRGWTHTKFWLFIKYPNYLYRKIQSTYHKINQIIYRSILKIISTNMERSTDFGLTGGKTKSSP